MLQLLVDMFSWSGWLSSILQFRHQCVTIEILFPFRKKKTIEILFPEETEQTKMKVSMSLGCDMRVMLIGLIDDTQNTL
jgi:hypothetical protein